MLILKYFKNYESYENCMPKKIAANFIEKWIFGT